MYIQYAESKSQGVAAGDQERVAGAKTVRSGQARDRGTRLMAAGSGALFGRPPWPPAPWPLGPGPWRVAVTTVLSLLSLHAVPRSRTHCSHRREHVCAQSSQAFTLATEAVSVGTKLRLLRSLPDATHRRQSPESRTARPHPDAPPIRCHSLAGQPPTIKLWAGQPCSAIIFPVLCSSSYVLHSAL